MSDVANAMPNLGTFAKFVSVLDLRSFVLLGPRLGTTKSAAPNSSNSEISTKNDDLDVI